MRQMGSTRLRPERYLCLLPLWLAWRPARICPAAGTRFPISPSSGFGGKEIRYFGGIYARDSSLRKWGNGSTAVALIPFRPGALVENSRGGVIQRGFEFVVTEVLPEDLNVLIRGVCHRIGQKAHWEFQCFFWTAKPDDALGDR